MQVKKLKRKVVRLTNELNHGLDLSVSGKRFCPVDTEQLVLHAAAAERNMHVVAGHLTDTYNECNTHLERGPDMDSHVCKLAVEASVARAKRDHFRKAFGTPPEPHHHEMATW